MNYQVGQAVIIQWDKNTELIVTYEKTKGDTIYTGGFINANDSGFVNSKTVRPATEAEILAEIQKHGWKDYSHLFVKSTVVRKDYFALQKTNTWRFEIQYNPEDTSDLKNYCEEGLIVDRIITALNLAK